MNNLKGFRHEDKYILDYSEYLKTKSKIEMLLNKDENTLSNKSYYIVSSMYFENVYNKCLNDKINGVNNREKFRIRYYNLDLSFIRLEKKIKINGLCKKLSCDISKEEYDKILKNDIQWMTDSNSCRLLNDLYIKMNTQLLRPMILVEYEREAFIYRGGNVRITFDKNLSTKVGNANINMMDLNKVVLEIKYDEFIPDVIYRVLKLKDRVSYSKYASCRII